MIIIYLELRLGARLEHDVKLGGEHHLTLDLELARHECLLACTTPEE